LSSKITPTMVQVSVGAVGGGLLTIAVAVGLVAWSQRETSAQPVSTVETTPSPPALKPRVFEPTWLVWSDNGRIRWRADVACQPGDTGQFQCMLKVDAPSIEAPTAE
jgi:hypothetical protein